MVSLPGPPVSTRPAVLMKTSSISSLPPLPCIWIDLASGTLLSKIERLSLPSLPWTISGWLGSSGHSTPKFASGVHGAPALMSWRSAPLSISARYVFGSPHGWYVVTIRLRPSEPSPR